MSHPVPARHPADRLAGLQGLFDKADLLVVTPSPPTLGAQHIDLHSRRDLKARLKVKSSGRLTNYTRRPPPKGYEMLAIGVDAQGREVLVGLTYEETTEYFDYQKQRLSGHRSPNHIVDRRRWLDLYQKHERVRLQILAAEIAREIHKPTSH